MMMMMILTDKIRGPYQYTHGASFVTVLLILRTHNKKLRLINVKAFTSYEITLSFLGLKTSNTDLMLAVKAYTYSNLRRTCVNTS
jgi:hypothetical protein